LGHVTGSYFTGGAFVNALPDWIKKDLRVLRVRYTGNYSAASAPGIFKVVIPEGYGKYSK
jgi:hypothetical protein